ncbi:MAG: hypothetical protein CL609_21465 [Anaerolineaceae bacterium]|nr:hypothetical protein [Anaerolineaceae bacterium]
MKDRLKQAYKQKPWRIQIQWVGRILLVLIISIISIVLHLNVTTQAAKAGVEIRLMEAERELLLREINNNRTQLAIITSAAVMQKRAEELGFRPATNADIEYLFINEYLNKEPEINYYQSTFNKVDDKQIDPQYVQSIWDLAFSGTLFYLERGGK